MTKKKGEPKGRVNLPDLKELGARLQKVDHHIVALLARRMDLAGQVEEYKSSHGGQPILRFPIEAKRLEQIKDWAGEKGLNPFFAQTILYLIISESCRVQISQLQARPTEADKLYEEDREAWYQHLKQNLLTLTAEIASGYDEEYGSSAPFATSSYLAFEERVIRREIETLRGFGNTGLALDLGCANGRITSQIAPYFERVVGCDISPQMIEQAKTRCQGNAFQKNMEFVTTDIEDGIPVDNDSVSLVVMNLGTSSDVRDLRKVIAGIRGVLKEDGRFVLSFYNSGALFYHWFIPWPISLRAEINLARHCLDVHFGGKTFQVYAKPYTVREAKKVIRQSGLKVSSVVTYPTLASILPNEFFEEETIGKSAQEIDDKLANMDKGAYILVTGRKKID